MSRIGNKAVEIPAKVKVNIGNDGAVAVEGPKGKLQWTLPREIKATVQDNNVSLARETETRSVKALHGLSRSLVNNMVQGVSEGFSKNLEIEGVGFKAAVQGAVLQLNLGKSHPILFPIPNEIKITVTDATKIAIAGIDEHRLAPRRVGDEIAVLAALPVRHDDDVELRQRSPLRPSRRGSPGDQRGISRRRSPPWSRRRRRS